MPDWVDQMPIMVPLEAFVVQAPIVPTKHGKSTDCTSPTRQKTGHKYHSVIKSSEPANPTSMKRKPCMQNDVPRIVRLSTISPIAPVKN